MRRTGPTVFELVVVGTTDDPEGGRRREPRAEWQEVGVSDGLDPRQRGDPFRDAPRQRAGPLLLWSAAASAATVGPYTGVTDTAASSRALKPVSTWSSR